MDKPSLIIIGGGIAGLVAARQLAAQYEVTVLEALPRWGGRIWTVSDGHTAVPVEAGAEFVHGTAEHTMALLEEAGLKLCSIGGASYHKKGQHLVKEEEDRGQWPLLMRKMAALESDMTLQDFLQQHFAGAAFAALRKQVLTFAGGFDLADSDLVSVKSLYQEWSHQSEDHRIEGGYGKLIDYLVERCNALRCHLQLNKAVAAVDWSADQVRVLTADQSVYHADKCLVTVPLGVLQKKSIRFTPPLEAHTKALKTIGFGTVIKVVLVFQSRFWEEDAGFIFSDEAVPTWWTQAPGTAAVLTGWAGGPKATLLEGYNDKKLLQKALESLAAIFGLTVTTLSAALEASYVYNWKKYPTALGADSYATLESTAALAQVNSAMADKLYFAGEACYMGTSPGTVEAAITTALQVVRRL